MAIVYGLYSSMVKSTCAQSLSHLKSKYLLYFPPRWVFRDTGTDVSVIGYVQIQVSVEVAFRRIRCNSLALAGEIGEVRKVED